MPKPVGRKELDIVKELKEKPIQWKVLSKNKLDGVRAVALNWA